MSLEDYELYTHLKAEQELLLEKYEDLIQQYKAAATRGSMALRSCNSDEEKQKVATGIKSRLKAISVEMEFVGRKIVQIDKDVNRLSR